MLTIEKLNIYKNPYLDAKNYPTLDAISIALSTKNQNFDWAHQHNYAVCPVLIMIMIMKFLIWIQVLGKNHPHLSSPCSLK